MEIFIFTRFCALPGSERALEQALRDVVPATREEEGCLGIHVYHSIRDPQIFYIHSRWKDEAAFNAHAQLPHTVKFIERAVSLVDHEIKAHRCELIE